MKFSVKFVANLNRSLRFLDRPEISGFPLYLLNFPGKKINRFVSNCSNIGTDKILRRWENIHVFKNDTLFFAALRLLRYSLELKKSGKNLIRALTTKSQTLAMLVKKYDGCITRKIRGNEVRADNHKCSGD